MYIFIRLGPSPRPSGDRNSCYCALEEDDYRSVPLVRENMDQLVIMICAKQVHGVRKRLVDLYPLPPYFRSRE
jgi:hypothetical protein